LRIEKEVKLPNVWYEKYTMMLTHVENSMVLVKNASCSVYFYLISQ